MPGDQIAAHCDGIPRNINNICFNALTLGYAKRLQLIDGSTVGEVMTDLDMELLRSPSGSAPSLSQSCSPSLDSLEPPDELNYRDRYSAAPRHLTKIAKRVTPDEQADDHAIPLTSDNDSNATERILQRDSSDLAGTEMPSEPKAPPEIAVTYPGSAGTTNAGAAARPDPREIKVEKGRKGGSGRPNSTAFLRSELNVFPFKYKTQTREWLAEPPDNFLQFKGHRAGSPVVSISDRGYRRFSSEKFCGLPISNFRQIIQAQSRFEDDDESEEVWERVALESALRDPDRPKKHTPLSNSRFGRPSQKTHRYSLRAQRPQLRVQRAGS